MSTQSDFRRGLIAGIPIGLGYLSVSFTFGILSVMYGLTWWQAVLVSMLTVTSAGQFSGIDQMRIGGGYLPMLIAQLTINIRYSFMSVSLSQKVSKSFGPLSRFFLSFFVTDEIFAVSSGEKEVTRSFFLGLTIIPYLGWSLGTLLGALLGNILPAFVLSALGVAIYGMFVAIVVPELKENKAVLVIVILAAFLSCLFYYVPFLKKIPGGITISICAVSAAAVGAFLFPVSDLNDSKAEGNSSSQNSSNKNEDQKEESAL